MGNTQSTQPSTFQKRPRHSNRLSKTPTNYAGNRLRTTWDQELFFESPPLSSDSPYSPYSPHSPHSPWLGSQPVHSPEPRRPINEILAVEPPSPASLHPSHGSGSQSAGDDGRARSNFGEMMGEFKRRMSRSGSRTRDAWLSHTHTQDLDVLDARFCPHFPTGGGNTQMQEPDRPFGLGVSTRDGFPPAETHRFPSIRRLSLYNPGKSTRSPKNLLQTIFSPRNTEQDGPAFSYWGRDRHVPMRRTSADTFFLYEMTRSSPLRASTPSDLEYSHLGRLKLGSLRVVNGSASPAPSERVTVSMRRQSFSDMKSVRLDHRNSSDLLRSRSRDWIDAYSAPNLPQTSYDQSSHLESSPNRLRTPRIDRSKSPLRSEYGGQLETPSNAKYNDDLPTFRLSWPKNPETFLGIPSIPGSMKDQPLGLRKSTSPEPNNESSQVVLTNSSANEFNDDLFDNENAELVVAENHEVVQRKSHNGLNRGGPMVTSTRNDTSVVRGRKTCPLTKADSGYSSASSNKSLQHHKLALTKRGGGEYDATAGQPNAITSGATKAIEECNESNTSRPTSRRRSLSETPPPVPRKDTPPILRTLNLHQYHSKIEKLAQVQSPPAQANASFSQRMGHTTSLSHDPSMLIPLTTPILSPTPVDRGFRSFLTDNAPETEQNSWLWSPDPSQYTPLQDFETKNSAPIHNQTNENTTAIQRSTSSVHTQKSADLAHFSHPHPLQAHSLDRPQSMVNLDKVDCTADAEPDICPRQPQYQQQEESQGCVRGSFFRHRSRSKKRNTTPDDRTGFFGHRWTGPKPTINPTQVLTRDAAPTIATKSVRHNRTLPNTRLDHDLPPIPSHEQEHESVRLDLITSSRCANSSCDNTSSRNKRRSNDISNDNDNNDREHIQPPSIFTGPFPLQNSGMFVKPKRKFAPGVERRRDPFFCVGLP
ncbi:hypothetical protein ACJ72_06650 [Emergomyces africanus]|uniref:Uncharacterized protein n=1 Tax=Emergomyces africanus TaxID=1955775 RepID=A0A1B7NQD1_9EURO|nr:hypothetical protein ACJ72_06650 [Emergomyces africanus]